jgi:hypothetical protein
MVSSYDIINGLYKCSLTSSSTEKSKILETIKESEEFHELCKFIFDPFTTLGAYPTIEVLKKDEPVVIEFDPTLRPVIDLMYKLSKREIVGNEARDNLNLVIRTYPISWQPWIKGFFFGELSTGVADGLIKRIYPDVIFSREVQLASGWDANTFMNNKSGWYYEPKFDGYRVVHYKDMEGTKHYQTRSFKDLFYDNFSHFDEELSALVDDGWVVDGEVVLDNNFNASSSVCRTKSLHPDARKTKFLVFDIFPVEYLMWGKDYPFEADYSERRSILTENLLNVPLNVFLSYSAFIGTDLVKAKRLKQYWIDKGYEGGVLKRANSLYTFSRDGSWMKDKKSGRDDFKIVGMIPGSGKYNKPPTLDQQNELSKYGIDPLTLPKLPHALGALIIEVNGCQCQVGTGFADLTRYELAAMHLEDRLVGRWAEIEFHSITEGNALREPVFQLLRTDK